MTVMPMMSSRRSFAGSGGFDCNTAHRTLVGIMPTGGRGTYQLGLRMRTTTSCGLVRGHDSLYALECIEEHDTAMRVGSSAGTPQQTSNALGA